MNAPAAAPSASGRYRWVVLAILLVAFLFNAMDRSIVSILGQPIKEELGLADWQLGLLGGLGFSLFYVAFGFPLARLADRGNRVTIISVCTIMWSVMTALCGTSANFLQLLLFRTGVGVGEAGCMPTSHSLISDYFPPGRRATALSIYGLGLPLGGLVGMVAGGVAMDAWGWRAAFWLVGLPGIAVGIVVRLFVKEPSRGTFDARQASVQARTLSIGQCARTLWTSPVSRHVLLAMTLSMVFTSPNSVFLAPYMVRKFGLGYSELGVILAVTFMLGSALSTLGSGFLVDWAAKWDTRWYLWIPAIGGCIGAPLYVIAYAQASWFGLAAILFVASIVGSTYFAPCYAVLHNNVNPGGRATMIAIVQLLLNVVGLGLGPLLCGAAIDFLAAAFFHGAAFGDFATRCPGGHALPGATDALTAACHGAVSEATQFVLIGTSACLLWPAIHFMLAARALKSARLPEDRAAR